MRQFEEIVKGRHDYARRWKERTRGKVLGYFCTYLPEEIVYAAGVLPVRILGSREPQDVSERHIYSMFCPFCRDCLAQGLKGNFDYLNGIAMANTCIHIRQAYASWVRNIPCEDNFHFFLSMPAKPRSPAAASFLFKSLSAFKRAVEEWVGKAITDEALDYAIEVYNTNRRLMRQVYELRKAENPPVSGAECMYMVLASQCMDKAEHNQLLAQILEGELPKREGNSGCRLMIVGSEDDDTEFLRLIESLGAIVVADDHCTGSRYFFVETKPQRDRLAAIAHRYLNRVPCPQKDYEGRYRWQHVLRLAEEYKVQGVLMIQQKFCDPHELDIPPLTNYLKERGNIPSLFLEFDVTVPAGQFRTRVEAFLELLQMGELEF